ncbi:hypothetical protein [Halostella pelagica]|uniref:hypothetical protein n=1 Tax=Halostella pelagica TaxID=2583824 RepID=UPI00108208A2|nr:hypothetical protein [Halostella pelagica]
MKGFAAGVVATVWKTAAAITGRRQGLTALPTPFPRALTERIVGEDAPEGPKLLAATVSHLGYGGTMGAAFALLQPRGGAVRGAAWGAFLWVIQQTVFFPFVGWGPFGRDLSREASLETLWHHLVYGLVLGVLIRDGPEDR